MLHDPNSIYKFEEHDIYLPLAVIDDLDDLKTKKEQVGWAAREVFRHLDEFDMMQLKKGVKVNEHGGKLFIYNDDETSGEFTPNIGRVNSDNAIIQMAISLDKKLEGKRKIIIVTKDTGLRVRATSWGCIAENYKHDLLAADKLYSGYKMVNLDGDQEFFNEFYKKEDMLVNKLPEEIFKKIGPLYPNELVVFTHNKQSLLTIYQDSKLYVIKEDKKEYMGIFGKNLEQKLALELLDDPDIPLVTLTGPAGTGKTILSLAVGLNGVNEGLYDRLIVIKPLIPVGGKDIGFLPGSKLEKISAWLGPMKDNILQLVCFDNKKSKNRDLNKSSNSAFEEMVEDGLIEVEAMGFIQGRSIPHSFIIVDESQGLTPREARMAVERCGEGSKIVLLGDLSQIENPYLDAQSCGLAHAINGGKNHTVAATMTLTKVERSLLAAAATEIFKNGSH